MRITLAVCLLFLQLDLRAQPKELSAGSDTVFWYKSLNTYAEKYGLEKTAPTKRNNYFRMWMDDRVIELFVNEGKQTAVVTFFVNEYTPNKPYKPNDHSEKFFFKKWKLTDKNAHDIFFLVDKYGLRDIPSDRNVPTWRHGFDGITYAIEYSDSTSYTFRTYWTPGAFPELKEAAKIMDFLTEFHRIEEIKIFYLQFMERQPFTSWHGGLTTITLVMKRTF